MASGAAGALLVTVLGGGIAYSAVPSAGGVISGCYQARSGQLRVVDADTGQSCSQNELTITWNQTGPQGPAGPVGPGAAYRIVEDKVWVERDSASPFEVSCRAGEYALSGSSSTLPGVLGQPTRVETLESANQDGARWRFIFGNSNAFDGHVRLQVVCVPASTVTRP